MSPSFNIEVKAATALPSHVELIVIAGLDPAIHPFRKNKKMDARIKPAHDGGEQRFNSSGIRCSVPATAPSWAAIAVCKGPETKGQYRSRSVTTTLREFPLWRTIKSGVLMKQIEHLPAVVLCATLVPSCSPSAPEKFSRAGRVPPGAAGCKANQASEAARGVPPAVRSGARTASPAYPFAD